jgi:hypothetical protein
MKKDQVMGFSTLLKDGFSFFEPELNRGPPYEFKIICRHIMGRQDPENTLLAVVELSVFFDHWRDVNLLIAEHEKFKVRK